MSNFVRIAFAALCFTTFLGAAPEPAKADPYRWCADYSGGRFGGGGGRNCYFFTLAQCRATGSGVGGYCSPNPFYDGRPIVTPEDVPMRVKRRRVYTY